MYMSAAPHSISLSESLPSAGPGPELILEHLLFVINYIIQLQSCAWVSRSVDHGVWVVHQSCRGSGTESSSSSQPIPTAGSWEHEPLQSQNRSANDFEFNPLVGLIRAPPKTMSNGIGLVSCMLKDEKTAKVLAKFPLVITDTVEF